MDGDAIPVLQILLARLDELELLLGIVDERAELLLLALTDVIAEELVHLTLDVAGGILQDVAEGLALAVDIGQKVLGALGQRHDGLEIDDLGRGGGDGGERLREQLQIVHVGLCGMMMSSHIFK